MYLQLIRQYHLATGDVLPGILTIYDEDFKSIQKFDTLENLHYAIPNGSYIMKLTFSPKFGRELPILEGVPRRAGIRIHAGNSSDDTQGCILLGKKTDNIKFIGNSRVSLQSFLCLCSKHKLYGKPFNIIPHVSYTD